MQTRRFGCWKSPITSDLIVSTTIGLGAIVLDGEDIYWLEGRPSEGGRNVLVRRTREDLVVDVTPQRFNVRTRVGEYGGGAYLIVDGAIYFSNFSDGRIYHQFPDTQPTPLTKESSRRYADLILDPQRDRLICVSENHTETGEEPENTLIAIALDSGQITTLVAGADFYSSPRLSPDGTQLAWLSWNHPNMPWDSTELWLATINPDGTLATPQCIAGSPQESISEPKWSPDGTLYFAADTSDWWNLYRYHRDGTTENIYPMSAEFAYPHWVFGLSTYDFVDRNHLICTYTQNGSWYLAAIDIQKKTLIDIPTPYNNISSLTVKNNLLAFIGGSFTASTAAVVMNLGDRSIQIVQKSSDLEIDSGYISIPEAIAFPTENGLIAHAWYYPPRNQDFTGEPDELPPLLVKSHGGPTAAASPNFNLRVQYWTSRGFAYLDVNYGGSTGYGRKYRQRLDGQWGVVDVDDCINAAKYLVATGKADPHRLAISGGSAGGYTTLAALTFKTTFKAGASYYGVSDLEALARDTHKFESRYLDRLIGAYPAEKEIYQARSPINFTDRLACPIAFFQGLEDRVVPPNQAEMMVGALKAKGLPVAYVAFEGEQHGFRRAENIKKALDGEFYFYSRVFKFEGADSLEPIEIFNLT
jgi:dipeptidyl aminopeptidase/acylaminoacyl peptidase